MSYYIFGYGSLIWNPGFPYISKTKGKLMNYQRSLCMYSWGLRGTPQNPGLILGLTKKDNSFCEGIIYEIDMDKQDEIVSNLIYRENTPSPCYDVLILPIQIEAEDKIINTLCFVSKEDHEQFAGHLTQDEKIKIISTARGKNGTTFEYLENTVKSLKNENIEDDELDNLYQIMLSIVHFSSVDSKQK